MAEEIEEAGDEDDDVTNKKGKLITKEEREKGAVAARVYLSYAEACGSICVLVALFLAVAAQGEYDIRKGSVTVFKLLRNFFHHFFPKFSQAKSEVMSTKRLCFVCTVEIVMEI